MSSIAIVAEWTGSSQRADRLAHGAGELRALLSSDNLEIVLTQHRRAAGRELTGKAVGHQLTRDQSLGHTVRGQSVGTMDAGVSYFTDGEQTAHGRQAVESRAHSAAREVGGRSHGDGLSDRVDASGTTPVVSMRPGLVL